MDSRNGWWVVFGCVITLTITTGVGFFSTAVLAEDILLQTGWSELDYSKAVTFWGISAALISPLSGVLIDRFGPRRMMVLGICIASAAEFMAGQVDVLWQFYAVMVIAPIGLMCCTYIPVATVVTHWFDKKISIATGLAMLGLGLGGGIFPIIARNLVTNLGYQTSFTWLAGTLLLAIVPTLLFIRSPRQGELDQREEEADEDSESSKEPASDLTLIESVRTRSFWALSMGDMLTGMVFMVFNTLLVLYLTNDTGDGDFATGVFSVLSFGLGFGILVFGPLGDLFNFNRVLSICYFLPALGTALLFTSLSPPMAYSFAVIAGFAGGGRTALFPVAIVNSFGGTHMAAIFGLSNMVYMLGNALGPVIAGTIFEATGKTSDIYLWAIGTFTVSAILVSLIRDERPASSG